MPPISVEGIDPTHSRKPFASFAKKVSTMTGHPIMFVIASLLILGWALSGRVFNYSNTWQLVINTTTTISTFLMVFLIQNSQNRDGASIQLKLDELIRSNADAHNALLDLEKLTDKELEMLNKKYEVLAAAAREKLHRGKKDTGTPEVF